MRPIIGLLFAAALALAALLLSLTLSYAASPVAATWNPDGGITITWPASDDPRTVLVNRNGIFVGTTTNSGSVTIPGGGIDYLYVPRRGDVWCVQRLKTLERPATLDCAAPLPLFQPVRINLPLVPAAPPFAVTVPEFV